MVKLTPKTPPNKISTPDDIEEKEKRKFGWMYVDDGPAHYALLQNTIEDNSPLPSSKPPLRHRKFGDEGNLDDDITAWNIRNRLDTLRKKCKAKPKQKRVAKKRSVKRCKCKI